MSQKTTLLLALFSLLISCKKTDFYVGDKDFKISKTEVVNKFFSFDNGIDPIVSKVLSEIKHRNLSGDFVMDFAQKEGFPVWDKAVVFSEGGADTLVYIPLVLNKTRYTSGFIRAVINKDISIQNFESSEYVSYPFLSYDAENSAENYALMFMIFDYKIFQHDRFIVKDNRLFSANDKHSGKREIKLMSIKKKNQSQLKFSDCNYITMEVTWMEADPENCNCNNPAICDWSTGCGTCSNTFSTTLSYYVGGCGGGGGSGSGGVTWNPNPPPGGGGGSTIGSSTPGWLPYPDDPTYQEFIDYTLTPTQQAFWNNPAKAGFVAPLIDILVQDNYDYESKTVVQNWVNFLIGSSITATEFNNYFMYAPEGSDGEYDANYWDDPNLTFTQDALPSFATFISAFPKTINGDNTISPMASSDVYELVGGIMFTNHQNNVKGWKNACAIRVSRALNYCSKEIDNNATKVEIGKDNKRYIIQAKALNKYLNLKYGAPTYRRTAAEINGDPQDIVDFLKGKNGIYSMLTNGGSFTGHADLIIDGICLSGTAINNINNVSVIEIWELN